VVASSPPELDDEVRPPRSGPRVGRVLVLVAVVGIVAMWGYVLYLAFGPGRQDPVDRLDDPTFGRRAEIRCAAALADIDALPNPRETETAAARAEAVDDANAVLRAMLDDLAAIVPRGEDARYAREWLADWALYLGDRDRYADAVRDDPEAGFLVSVKPGESRQVSIWIDEFAKANRMPSCAVPSDV
jgi:hypothetical protein